MADGGVFGVAVDGNVRVVVGGPVRFESSMVQWARRAGLGVALKRVCDGGRVRYTHLVPNRPHGAARMVRAAGAEPVEQFRRLMG